MHSSLPPPQMSKLDDTALSAGLCAKAGLPPGTPLRAFEEVKPHPVPRLDELRPDVPIGQHGEMQDGDIICYEAAPSEVRPQSLRF